MSPMLPRHERRRADADHPRRRRQAGADAAVGVDHGEVQEAGVPAELVVKKGGGHGWPTILADFKTIADWFDKYLKSPATAQAAK